MHTYLARATEGNEERIHTGILGCPRATEGYMCVRATEGELLCMRAIGLKIAIH